MHSVFLCQPQGRGPFDEIDQLMIPDNYKDMFLLDDPFGGKHMNILKVRVSTM